MQGHRHRDYFVQIPISREPGARHKVHDLKKHTVTALYLDTNFYSGFSGYDVDGISTRSCYMNELDDGAQLDYFPRPERAPPSLQSSIPFV